MATLKIFSIWYSSAITITQKKCGIGSTACNTLLSNRCHSYDVINVENISIRGFLSKYLFQ